MNRWKEVFLQVFGKKTSKFWKTATINIQLVDHDLKAAYLFDLWLATPEEMLMLIQHLINAGLIRNTLSVASVGSDVIVYNLRSLMSFLKGTFPHISFVDITPVLHQPDLISQSRVQKTVEIFTNFVYKTSQSFNTPAVHTIKLTTEFNGPCIFGLFLGYPCVYWYNSYSEDENCLTDQPLVLFQVMGDLSGTLLKDYNPHTPHIIYSFSVPLNLIEIVRPVVEKWFKEWKRDKNWSTIFSDVSLNTETVNPKVFCL